MTGYGWVKVIHILAVISWMAALLYLPRLFVYHADAKAGSELSETLKIMERRLLRGIATPAMVGTWIFGLWLAFGLDVWAETWFLIKLLMVILMTVYHFHAVRWQRDFAGDRNEKNQRYYRFVNEVPALIMVLIVVMVVIKPF